MRVLISPHPHRYIWLSMFLITAILLGCKVICHCGFDLHFPNGLWCWATFHVLVDHLYFFLRDMSLEILCHLKILFILANIYWAPTVYWLTGMRRGTQSHGLCLGHEGLPCSPPRIVTLEHVCDRRHSDPEGKEAQAGEGPWVSEALSVPCTLPGACLAHWLPCHTQHQCDWYLAVRSWLGMAATQVTNRGGTLWVRCTHRESQFKPMTTQPELPHSPWSSPSSSAGRVLGTARLLEPKQ